MFESLLRRNDSKSFSLVVMIGTLMASPSHARQMDCSYDYVTHKTTIQLEELQTENTSVSYSYQHEVSPVGGEEMYIFDGGDAVNERGIGQIMFVSDKLFYWNSGYVDAIVFVDFENLIFKEMQSPAYALGRAKDLIDATLIVWTCQRND